MKKIPSFTVDHTRLLRGIYLSRRDVTPAGDVLSTFDVRLTEPNRQPAIKADTLHTIEHLAATFLRNHPQWADKIVYWGPMGCLTGCYMIVQGDYRSADVVELLRECFAFIASYTGEIPGASARDCGNYTFMNPEDARRQARIYLDEVLAAPEYENLNYPE